MRDVNSLNKVILVGRLGGKPELRYLAQSETAVANFSLATNERTFNPNTNESDTRVEWHRIVAWGKQAEFCEKFLSQGKQVLVEGRIRTRKWQDREGNTKYTTEIHSQNIVLLGKKEVSVDDRPYPESKSEPEFPSENISTPEEKDDDEVPF